MCCPVCDIQELSVPVHHSEFDLTLNLAETDGHIAGVMIYATALFDAATIARYVGYLKKTLGALVADCHQSVARLDILSDAERQQILVEWNDTATEYAADQCIHQLFEAQVARTPEAIAVVFEEQSLSYAQLNARANQLAPICLWRQGVGPESVVALCVPRSLEMVGGTASGF